VETTLHVHIQCIYIYRVYLFIVRNVKFSDYQAAGCHRNQRKSWHTGRPQYRVSVRRVDEAGSLKLCMTRKSVLKKYSYRSRKCLLTVGRATDQSLYTVRVVSTSAYVSLKRKISKVRDVGGDGYRVINLDCLKSHVMDITLHAAMCDSARQLAVQGLSPIRLVTELRTSGLASVLLAECQDCKQTF
jgi:hypothetical protein